MYNFVASCQELDSTYFASCFPNTKRIAWFRSEYSVYKHQNTQAELDRERRLYHRFNQIICVSQTTRDDFALYFEDIQDRIFAIHNIQDTDNIEKKQPNLLTTHLILTFSILFL